MHRRQAKYRRRVQLRSPAFRLNELYAKYDRLYRKVHGCSWDGSRGRFLRGFFRDQPSYATEAYALANSILNSWVIPPRRVPDPLGQKLRLEISRLFQCCIDESRRHR